MEIIITLVNIPVMISMAAVGVLTYVYREQRYIAYFSYMIAATILWLLVQYVAQIFADGSGFWTVVLMQTTSAIAGFVGYFFLMFVSGYADNKSLLRIGRYLLVPVLLFIPFNYSGLMISAAHASPYGITIDEAGILYTVEVVLIAIYFAIGIAALIQHTLKTKKEKRSGDYILIVAVAQAAVFAIIAAVVFASYALSQILIPITLAIMILLIAVSIVRHRLFDIRLAAARAVAYFLSFSVILIVYAMVVNMLRLQFTGSLHWLQDVIGVTLFILVGVTYPALKKFFDKATNRIFYRDAYDAQDFLDELNSVLVGNVDLHKVIVGVSEVVGKNLKSEFVDISLRDRSGTLVTSNSIKFAQADGQSLRKELEAGGGKAVNIELLAANSKLRRLMKKYNIALAYPLLPVATNAIIGYLFIGSRKSGNLYNSADQRLLDSVSDELSIAVQNALYLREIKKFSQTLEHKVEEQTKDLRAKNEKLKRLDEAKDEFISMASHQLRTPLTSVKGYISMVLDGDVGKLTDDQRKILEQAFGSSQRMVYLIGDFLNVSRIQTGKFEIERAPVNLAGVVSQEINQLVETAKTKRITMTYEVPENFPTIDADENKLRQVMMNFMDNAIYYSPADTKIKVQLYKDADAVVFKVTDQGIGVPKADQPKLFTKFFRAPNAKQQRPDGTGIGLYMAKKVIVGHHGTVLFETKEGKGSTFGFKLPIKSSIK